jgi:hypothetical protein
MDVHVIGIAIEPMLGVKPGTVDAALRAQFEDASKQILDAPFPAALIQFLDEQPNERWEGLYKDLFEHLSEIATRNGKQLPKYQWPPDVTKLSGWLRRIKPDLYTVGIEIETPPRTKAGQPVVIRKTLDSNSAPSEKPAAAINGLAHSNGKSQMGSRAMGRDADPEHLIGARNRLDGYSSEDNEPELPYG